MILRIDGPDRRLQINPDGSGKMGWTASPVRPYQIITLVTPNPPLFPGLDILTYR